MTEPVDLAMLDMECAIETITASRQLASTYRQLGFLSLARYHQDNATGAERWLLKAGKHYPHRCDSDGKRVTDSR